METEILIDGWKQLLQANKLSFNNLNAAEQIQVTDLIRATIAHTPAEGEQGIVDPEEFNDE
jgi:hypothetical protein